MMNKHYIHTNGGFGDYLITTYKIIEGGHDASTIIRKHSDGQQTVHYDSIVELSNIFGFELQLSTDHLPEDYSTKADENYLDADKFIEFLKKKGVIINDDCNYYDIVIQTSSGEGVNKRSDRTWSNEYNINLLINKLLKKQTVAIVGREYGIIEKTSLLKSFIGAPLMESMQAVTHCGLFIGWDGFFSYLRAFIGKEQICRNYQLYNVYNNSFMKKHTNLYDTPSELINLIKPYL